MPDTKVVYPNPCKELRNSAPNQRALWVKVWDLHGGWSKGIQLVAVEQELAVTFNHPNRSKGIDGVNL